MNPDPRGFYSERLEQRRAEIAASERRHRSLGYWRLAAAGCAVILVCVALAGRSSTVLWAGIPAAGFVALAVIHERLLRGLERRRRAAAFYERGLARLDGAWAGTGATGDGYLDPAHLYAQDLDLFGKGSVFELLCTARTHIGEDTLARWLLEPADPATVRARQEAVEELRPRVDLREDLAIQAEAARTGVDPVSLARWGEAPALLRPGWARAGVWALTALGTLGLAAFFAFDAVRMGLLSLPEPATALLRDGFLLALAVNLGFLYRFRKKTGPVIAAVGEAAHELQLLSETLVRLEAEQFRSPLLADLRASLDADGDPPSNRLARLDRLIQYLDSSDHLLVRVAEPFALWSTHLAFGVENWRRKSGAAVRRWLTAMGEIEALCSLASHAFEHPADPFPEFTSDGPWLDAEGIAHPLIPEDRVVRNDVRLGGELRVLVVSGSNMSGKSTLLRTLGVNAVLAQAGATVRARRLTISPLAVGASIRVTDSLQGGVSRFYAEILRLRHILDQTAGPLPVLFLVDECLHGTNSHDRLIGAEALVRGLVARGAAGLVTTHDLALAAIADSPGERAANVHFEDRIEDGQIHFDFILRPGVVRRSNALELMRSVGLEI
ncbi:MAG: DNA mismatch repair protein MutS [Bryobacteraceae bacterium]